MQDEIIRVLNPTIQLIYAAGFFALWLRAPKLRFVLILAVAGLARTIGAVWNYSPLGGLVEPGVLVTYSLYCFAIIALVWAVCTRARQSVDLITMTVIAATGGTFVFFAFQQGQTFAVGFAANVAFGLIVALGAQAHGKGAKRTGLDRAITILLALYAAQFFVRPFFALIFAPEFVMGAARNETYDAVAIFTYAIATVSLSTALIAAILIDLLKELEKAGETDSLTGLFLRRSFEEKALSMLDRAKEEEVEVSMIVADIDHFKQVNDLWGHQAGDEVIQSFGQTINGLIRGTDIAGRIGGEEFCVLVWDCHAQGAEKLAERIRKTFGTMQHDSLNADVRVTASFGVSVWCGGEGYGRLFGRADSALYDAKRSGRNRVQRDCEKNLAECEDQDMPAEGSADGSEREAA